MEQFDVRTPSHACMVDITDRVSRVVADSGIEEGICYVFVPHTTAGLTINENADQTVQSDILNRLDKIVPWRDGYEHAEGNSAAHIKASMMGSSHLIPVRNGRLRLGTWQGVYLCEFDGPRSRHVWVKVVAG
ncbi:MAG: secondary thiamine-phosphate synthase enzyme YjbQ [Anaerolineae bacterium]|jgi:secondary thiamine-phosphate synthase enzyme